MAWHGRATGTWWAYDPYGSNRRLIESPTPEELARQIIQTGSGYEPDGSGQTPGAGQAAGSGQAKPPSLQWWLDENSWPVRAARRHVTTTLGDWGLEDRLDDALLLVSELVTNSQSHGRPPMTLSLTLAPSLAGTAEERPDIPASNPDALEPVLIIEVGDGSTEPPVRNDPGDHGGFGLTVIAALAEVTVHFHEDGKTIRAVLRRF
jgi:hypothetical protein